MTTQPLLAEAFRRPQDDQPSNARLWADRKLARLASARQWVRIGTRILWFELRSFVPRIKIGFAAIAGLPEGAHDLGPLYEESTDREAMRPCIRTDARTLDVERLQTIAPWATSADEWIFLLGWEMGESFACGSPYKIEKAPPGDEVLGVLPR